MSLQADALVERRRTRRKLAVWRALAFVAAAAALVAVITALGGGFDRKGAPHIARIAVTGVILQDPDVTRMLRQIEENEAVAGVIVAIDSPGGSTTGGEALYDGIRKIAARKPVVATVGTLAASAGYMTAIAADHIVVLRTSITGSIGVYFQYGNVAELLERLGVSVNTVKSAPLKAEPSPFTPEVPGAREMIARLIDDSYRWFVDIVAERRGLDRAEALRLSDGSIYSGRQALELRLVDAIGDEETAIAWLEKEKGVPVDLPVIDWKPTRDYADLPIGSRLVGLLARSLGFSAAGLSDLPALDGLVSVWHPQLSDLQ